MKSFKITWLLAICTILVTTWPAHGRVASQKDLSRWIESQGFIPAYIAYGEVSIMKGDQVIETYPESRNFLGDRINFGEDLSREQAINQVKKVADFDSELEWINVLVQGHPTARNPHHDRLLMNKRLGEPVSFGKRFPFPFPFPFVFDFNFIEYFLESRVNVRARNAALKPELQRVKLKHDTVDQLVQFLGQYWPPSIGMSRDEQRRPVLSPEVWQKYFVITELLLGTVERMETKQVDDQIVDPAAPLREPKRIILGIKGMLIEVKTEAMGDVSGDMRFFEEEKGKKANEDFAFEIADSENWGVTFDWKRLEHRFSPMGSASKFDHFYVSRKIVEDRLGYPHPSFQAQSTPLEGTEISFQLSGASFERKEVRFLGLDHVPGQNDFEVLWGWASLQVIYHPDEPERRMAGSAGAALAKMKVRYTYLP